MTNRVTLELVSQAGGGSPIVMGDAPLQIGRSPTNDVVLTDSTVSWHHAMLWMQQDRIWLRDLGSRNGTFVNDARVGNPQPLAPGDEVRVGDVKALRVPHELLIETPRSFVVENLDALGRAFPVRDDGLHIGSGPAADIFIEGEELEASLWVELDGTLCLKRGDVQETIEAGTVFTVAGLRLRAVAADPLHVATTAIDQEHACAPYRLETTLNGATGPEARLVDLQSGEVHMVSAGNPAVMLHVLAEQLLEDRASGLDGEHEGWVEDRSMRRKIWGRRDGMDPNIIHVLLYRLRNGLKRDGFDPWFVQKRRAKLRIRVREAVMR
jgi:hypothetical protein